LPDLLDDADYAFGGSMNANIMTEGKPWKHLARFALPLILGSAFQLLYTVADSAVVGRLVGVSAFAAVGATSVCFMLALTVVLGLTQGFGLVFSRRFGKGDMDGLWRAWRASCAISLLLGCLMSVACGILAKPMLSLMSTPDDILGDASLYMSILMGGLVVTFEANTAYALLRGLGDSKTPMAATMISSVVNVGLDIFLVKAFSAGVAGVAIATLASQVFSCAFCHAKVSKIFRGMHGSNAASLSDMKELLGNGSPLALRNLIISLGGLAMQSAVNSFGTVFIAGIAAAWKLYGLLEIIGGAAEGATAVFVAQNFGAGKTGRVKEVVRIAAVAMIASSILISMIALVFGRQLLSIQVSGENAGLVIGIGKMQLNFMAAALPFLYLLFLFRAALQGMGKMKASFASGIAEMGTRILCSAILPLFFGEWGVYTSQVAGWPVAAILLGTVYFACRRRIKAT
jgi:putative MATE family efflux protein